MCSKLRQWSWFWSLAFDQAGATAFLALSLRGAQEPMLKSRNRTPLLIAQGSVPWPFDLPAPGSVESDDF
jgi:hypothetical protein